MYPSPGSGPGIKYAFGVIWLIWNTLSGFPSASSLRSLPYRPSNGSPFGDTFRSRHTGSPACGSASGSRHEDHNVMDRRRPSHLSPPIVRVDVQSVGITVSVSPDSSRCATWPKTYCVALVPAASVKVQITSNRSPGHTDGITVFATTGNEVASAGM